MCGRFALHLQAGAFAEIFGCAPPDGYRAGYNIVPDRPIVAIRQCEEGRPRQLGREAVQLTWGLLPPWAEAPDDRGRQINARSETVFEKPTFKSAALKHRCLIPASGFYEWQKGGGASQPFYIHRSDGLPVAMAGIWRRSRFAGRVVESCAILTMDAYASIAGIHHRMPIMLDPAAWDAWLSPGEPGVEALRQALQPLPEAAIGAHPVSRAVNNPTNDTARLLEPEAAPPEPAQGALF